MDFGVLGALSVTERGQAIALGGPIQRRLLAALVAHAPHPVSSETLIDDVWGDSAPATAMRTLHSHVARLRDTLGRDSAHAIETVDSQYRLPLQRADVDAWVFEDLVRSATANGHDPVEASGLLRQALQLWRGSAYGEFVGAPFADAESRRLESLRESALESAIEADLAAGKGVDLVPELEALVVEHPFRERLWSALVIALYRAGRQADALDAYQRARAVLGDELGVDPGPELRAVEARVLAQDPSLLTAPPTRVFACPWKGLASYEPRDADFFVGRDRVVNEVIARLVDYSVVIVTGPSGSGKSSLVRAGVIPALSQGAIIGSSDWRVTLLTPGARPLQAVCDGVSGAPDVLIIDPGDDLLAVSGAEDVGPIAETLRDAIAEGLRVVLTLRGDLYGRLTELNALAPRAGAGTVLVGPPTDGELRQVVELPAARVGLAVEPALLDAVVSDVAGRPGSLPLMSTALVRTWERREGNRLTLAGYVAAGGTASALERLAEEAYASMSDDERVAARRILLRLVVNDDGLWRRRSAPIADVAGDSDESAARALVVLSDHRLVSLDVGVVQLSHEALTSAWPRFASWLAEREQGAAVFDHLAASAVAWQSGGRDDADLYRGTRLQAALDLESKQPQDFGALEHEFIARSHRAADREVSNLRRGRRRLMLVALGLVVLLVVASLAGVLAVRSRNEAALAAVQADAQRVGLQALNRTDVSQKLLLAVAAVRLYNNAGTQASLLTALQGAGSPTLTVPLAEGSAQTLSVSDDGWVGVSESSGAVEAFGPALDAHLMDRPSTNWTAGQPTGAVSWLKGHATMLVGATKPARIFTYDPGSGGSSLLATGWNPNVFGATGDGAWVAGTPDGAQATPILLGRRAEGSGTDVRVPLQGIPTAISAGPGPLVTVVEPGHIQVVDVGQATVRWTVRVPQPAQVAVSADGRHAAAITPRGVVTIIDLTSGLATASIPPLGTSLSAVALSDDGSLLAGSGDRDGVIRVWSTTTGVERARFASDLGPVQAIAWAPGGDRMYTVPVDQGAVQAWDLSRFVSPAKPVSAAAPARAGATTATDVDPTTRTLVAGSETGHVWFIGLDGSPRMSTGATRAPIVSVAFADRGRLVLSADAGGVLSLWDAATASKITDLTKASRVDALGTQSRAPMAPDGRTAASFVDGYGLRLIDTLAKSVGPPVYPDLGNLAEYEVLGWSPDGRHVVIAATGVSLSPTATTSPGTWALVDPHDGSIIWRTQAPEQVVAADVAFADHGHTIVVPGASGRLYFLDAGTGRLMLNGASSQKAPPAVNDRQTPASVSVSPGGDQMSIVSAAHPVEIWDVNSGQQSGTIDVPGDTVTALFASDHELVTTTSTGAVTVHDLTVADWIARACGAAGRELSTDEWQQFLPAYPYRQLCNGTGASP